MEGLTKSARKLFASLSTNKGRRENGMFMAQGTKCVLDTIENFEVVALIASQDWVDKHREIAEIYDPTIATATDLQKISTLTTPPQVIGVYIIPEDRQPQYKGRVTLALDGVQDPGNLGTIIRVCDWMGVTDIIASLDTVDVWNPKVVQATMGAISRVNVHYTDLCSTLKKAGVPVYGTFLDGSDIYKSSLSTEGIIVMGNEGNGIRQETETVINRRLFIPPYPAGAKTSESLNVAIATAITLSEFRRRM